MDYVVDAHSRAVVSDLPRTPSAAIEHEALDGLGARRRFRVEQSGQTVALEDTVLHVATYDFAFGDPSTDAGRLPGELVANPPEWRPEAVSAHANASAVVQFLRTVLLRNGIDNRGGPMVSTINCVVVSESTGPQEWHNAYWDPNLRQMVYGQARSAGGLRSLSVNLDIVAHEIFHGITDSTSRLEYANQPGALNESYSDIFGAIISNLGKEDPRDWNWELGEGLLSDRVAFRDLSDPPRFDQPDHMRDFRRLPNTRAGDWGGVHVNSGIHNKAAYNMLTATDGPDRTVFTPSEVAAVFYLALTQRLSRTSQFVDSRRAVIDSARTLFRSSSAEERSRKVAAIEDAFSAVGI
jgi:bacillolysin/neutral peptidase B